MTKIENNVTNVLVDSLVYNNRFATVKLNAEQLGAENFGLWKNLVNDLHRKAYNVYAKCENNGLKVADSTVDKTEVFDSIRAILKAIGEVKEHKMYANEESAIAIIGYSGKRGNADSVELQYCDSRIRGLRNEIKAYEKLNVNDKDYKTQKLAEMNEQLDALKDEKDNLIKTADMRIKQPTMTTESAFRLEVEHLFARAIVGQMAKSLEELDKEAEDRKNARKEKAKARKQAKAKAQA